MPDLVDIVGNVIKDKDEIKASTGGIPDIVNKIIIDEEIPRIRLYRVVQKKRTIDDAAVYGRAIYGEDSYGGGFNSFVTVYDVSDSGGLMVATDGFMNLLRDWAAGGSPNPPIEIALGTGTGTLEAEYDEANQDANQGFGSTTWLSQSFTITSGDIRGFKAKIWAKYNTGTQADIILELYEDDGAGKPTGSALATATITAFTDVSYGFREAFFDPNPTLINGDVYHLVVKSPSASATNTYHLGVDSSSPSYTGGTLVTSVDSGSNWTVDSTRDACFEVYRGSVTTASVSDTELDREISATRKPFSSIVTLDKEVQYEHLLLVSEGNSLDYWEVGLFNADNVLCVRKDTGVVSKDADTEIQTTIYVRFTQS